MMAESGVDSREFLTFMAADSAHVADDGNYSIEVLRRALATLNLILVPLTHPDERDARANPTNEEGFLLNNSSHWFALRKIAGTWYNLNSLNSGPEVVGDLYLSTCIETLIQAGWTCLAVRGPFPTPEQFTSAFVYDPACWKPAVDARAGGRRAPAPAQRAALDDDDAALNAAIRASLQPRPEDVASRAPIVVADGVDDEQDADLLAAMALSLAGQQQ